MIKVYSKIRIILSVRKWPFKYIDWRLTTAYPGGWRYALRHPFELINDMWKYLTWCEEIDKYIEE